MNLLAVLTWQAVNHGCNRWLWIPQNATCAPWAPGASTVAGPPESLWHLECPGCCTSNHLITPRRAFPLQRDSTIQAIQATPACLRRNISLHRCRSGDGCLCDTLYRLKREGGVSLLPLEERDTVDLQPCKYRYRLQCYFTFTRMD